MHNQKYLNELFYPVHNDFYFYFKGGRVTIFFPYVLEKWELKSGIARLQCSYRRIPEVLGKRRAEEGTTAFYRYWEMVKTGGKRFFY